MKNISILPPLVLYQDMELRFPTFSAQVLLVFVALQLPIIGWCDSGNGWFRNFESKGSDMKKLTLTREVIIKDETGLLPEPQVISKTSDGGFVIAGSLGRAWAVKTDAAGKVLWRNLQDKPFSGNGYATTFTGAVAMPDGSTYLCGNVSFPSGGYTPSLLLHLDAEGHVINEHLFVPQKRTEHGLGYFDSCIRWGDGMLIVGHIFQFNNSKDFLKNDEHYYWLLMLGATGQIKWEKQIPTSFDTIDGTQSMLVASDSSLVFAGYRTGKTELFCISMAGELTSKKSLEGLFAIVRPVMPDDSLQIYGLNPTDKAFEVITFNDRLEETRRIQGGDGFDFGGRFAYRMPDQSLVLFGAEHHTLHKSAIAHVDPQLRSVQKIELIHDAQFYDNGFIDAAAPTGNADEFVTARKLLKHVTRDEVSEEARVGLVLDFIQIK